MYVLWWDLWQKQKGVCKERESYHTVSSQKCMVVWGCFADTYTELTPPWPRWSSTPLFRDMLHLLLCIFVDKDSYCSGIMTQNKRFARITRRLERRPEESWWTFQHSHLASTQHLWRHLRLRNQKHSVTSQEARCQIRLGHQVHTNVWRPCQLEYACCH